MESLADAKGDITLSLQRVLGGIMAELGGPESLGKVIGEMIKDGDLTIASRVSLVNNVTRLMGQYGEGGEDDNLMGDDQIKARWRQLNAIPTATDESNGSPAA